MQVDFPIFQNIEDTLDLRHFLILLKANLQREDLLFFQKEFTQEINERASVIFETLPGIAHLFLDFYFLLTS